MGPWLISWRMTKSQGSPSKAAFVLAPSFVLGLSCSASRAPPRVWAITSASVSRASRWGKLLAAVKLLPNIRMRMVFPSFLL